MYFLKKSIQYGLPQAKWKDYSESFFFEKGKINKNSNELFVWSILFPFHFNCVLSLSANLDSSSEIRDEIVVSGHAMKFYRAVFWRKM